MMTAAVFAFAGAANAQDAYITQMGDSNDAANVSQNPTSTPNLQIIQQQANDADAVNLAEGGGNFAYAYQLSPASSSGMNALIWQDADGNGVNANMAANIAVHTNGNLGANQQIVQYGDENRAINWSDDTNGDLPKATVVGLIIPAPSLDLSNLVGPSEPQPNSFYTLSNDCCSVGFTNN
ncbi:hypothetical protein OG2516_18195 [Oceanicola granulosus HTCC2516]|uniref:Uncharacterized protein n=2 Tax=Oceanicola granulosus TaxID=252302 RepID=Q2CEK5_OCEGH|nr:hypothetical protein OG2516_18195 [Oceanicola granulosus HTCC2516]